MHIGPSANVLQALGSSPSPPEPVRTSSEAVAASATAHESAADRPGVPEGGEAKARPVENGQDPRLERSAAPGTTSATRVDILV